jgi:hypothetical protein
MPENTAPEIKVKYKDVTSFEFNSAMQKIVTAPIETQKAEFIRKIFKQLKEVREIIGKEYEAEIMEKFAQKDEAGKILRPPEEPNGFLPVEGKDAEIMEANKVFGDREAKFSSYPLNPSILKDIKLSGKDLDALGNFYAGEVTGPGLPDMASVTPLRQ